MSNPLAECRAETVQTSRLSRALDAACDYIRNIEGPPPASAETWREWWLKLIDENQDQQG